MSSSSVLPRHDVIFVELLLVILGVGNDAFLHFNLAILIFHLGLAFAFVLLLEFLDLAFDFTIILSLRL